MPEGLLFQTHPTFCRVKQVMLEGFNLTAVVSLPPGVFLPYSTVKTNVLFLENTGPTEQIWFYEVSAPEKLTRKRRITDGHFREFLAFFPEKRLGENAWSVNGGDIQNFDLSAKKRNRTKSEAGQSTAEPLNLIRADNERIEEFLKRAAAAMKG